MRGGGINKTEEKVVDKRHTERKGKSIISYIDKVMLLPFYL